MPAMRRDSVAGVLTRSPYPSLLDPSECHAEDAHAVDDRFRWLVESIEGYAIFILDPDGRVSSWNPGAQQIKGYRASEIVGQHFSIFYPPEANPEEVCPLELEVAAREGRFVGEGWCVRKDGTRIWASVVMTPLKNRQGMLIGFARVLQDLTERRAAVEEARRFRLLVESVKDYAIFILDPQGYVSTWNAGAERIKGYQASEIIGRHFSVFYPAEDEPASLCKMELEVASREGRFEAEGWRIRKDGSRFWAKVVITALRNPEGTLVGFAKVTQDLTVRRNAEEEARRFQLLVETVKDYAIFILDRSGRVSTWNAGAERIKGYQATEIIGQHFSVFYPREADPEATCAMELEVAARDGRFEAEGERVRKDGSRFWANVVITALRDANGVLLGFAKVTQDLTTRKQAEEARRVLVAQSAALAEKERIQQFQERFLAVLGHDLRNPLASFDMGLGILRQRVQDTTTLRILDRMSSSSLRMSRMVEQILDLTRSRLASGLEVDPKRMDLGDTLRAIVEELRAAHPAQAIALSCPSLPGNWDPDRLEQVFSNLIGNAILHGDPARPITVEARAERDTVCVEVHNEGPPIPEALQANIFDPFRRGERDSRTSKTSGLGLGLYISREVLLAHGGQLGFQSNSIDGTTFRATLPRTEKASGAEFI
jgi:PAS domain S-box-containing protein